MGIGGANLSMQSQGTETLASSQMNGIGPTPVLANVGIQTDSGIDVDVQTDPEPAPSLKRAYHIHFYGNGTGFAKTLDSRDDNRNYTSIDSFKCSFFRVITCIHDLANLLNRIMEWAIMIMFPAVAMAIS
ncbi:hypothetical protein [Holospora undulata]|uniref:Uncharacterized protein n=1 Tax=Holospora undulata HU1 TaxID=1321371 RepID=A0A061JGX1_9PROT|nr:hypothetical protein [Holospora undulata]ETZ05350.1 hypothetical protein K737_300214 [Holospora undulata HU1]